MANSSYCSYLMCSKFCTGPDKILSTKEEGGQEGEMKGGGEREGERDRERHRVRNRETEEVNMSIFALLFQKVA